MEKVPPDKGDLEGVTAKKPIVLINQKLLKTTPCFIPLGQKRQCMFLTIKLMVKLDIIPLVSITLHIIIS